MLLELGDPASEVGAGYMAKELLREVCDTTPTPGLAAGGVASTTTSKPGEIVKLEERPARPMRRWVRGSWLGTHRTDQRVDPDRRR